MAKDPTLAEHNANGDFMAWQGTPDNPETEVRSRDITKPCDTCGAAPQEECSYTLHGTGELEDLEEHDEEFQVYKPRFYSAAIFHVSQAYGGPEEGGWWYEEGEPSDEPDHALLTRIFRTAEEAYFYANALLKAQCDKDNEGQYPKHSVLSHGVFEPHVTGGYPVAFPTRRPHYE